MEECNAQIIESLKNKALDDTLVRLGRDTKRKLSVGDRCAGAATLCTKYNIFPGNIGRGIAFGFIFGGSNDNGTVEVRRYVETKGIEAAIKRYCGIMDKKLVEVIVDIYADLQI